MNVLARHARVVSADTLGSEHGFTLTELLVTCAILGIIMTAAATVQMTGTTVATIGESKAEAQQSARAAMTMEEDIRLAGFGYPPSQPKFAAASPTAISFWADLVNASTTLAQPVNPGDRTLNVASGGSINPGDTVYLINGDQWESLTVASATASAVTVTAGTTGAYPSGT